MDMKLHDNKRYERYTLSGLNSIFEGYYGDYAVDTDILIRLSKSLGFSYDLYSTLSNIDTKVASSLVKSMSAKSNQPEIALLIDEEEKKVLDYSLEYERLPILNSEFIYRVKSIAEANECIEVSEVSYHKNDTLSSIILKKKDALVIEEKYQDRIETINYDIGVLLVNDEVNTTYTRLVIYIDGQPLYLPASFYNATTTRFKRSTSSSVEALEVLVLKVIEDMRDDFLYNKFYEFHHRYRGRKNLLATYEEYNTVLRTMRKIPTIIDDNSFLESLLSKYEEFERKYSHLEDQKSSYIWRCTAISSITLDALVSITSNILSELGAPPMEYFAIRDLLGSYVSTNRIVEEIAREDTY